VLSTGQRRGDGAAVGAAAMPCSRATAHGRRRHQRHVIRRDTQGWRHPSMVQQALHRQGAGELDRVINPEHMGSPLTGLPSLTSATLASWACDSPAPLACVPSKLVLMPI
jgi:hypothetical protein